MSDCVAIAPELSFRQQIAETLQHASRSMDSAGANATRDMLTTFDQQLKQEDSEAARQEMVRKVVNTYVETKGALDAVKDNEVESCHLLLQHIIATNFDTNGEEYAKLVKSVIEAIRVGGEAAAEAGRTNKSETAARVLNHIYNFLAPTSPLRSTALLALIQLLAAADELEHLPLTSTILSAALAQWSMSDAEKIDFLSAAAGVYIAYDNANQVNFRAPALATALEFVLLALKHQVSEQNASLALALSLGQPTLFDIDDVVKVQGVQDALTGKAAELVGLFSSADELEVVPKAAEWVQVNDDYVKGLGVARLDGKAVLRKVRLIAFATLAARSATKTIPYADIATALNIDVADVEAWVIDAIRAKLLDAQISQPKSVVNIISVSSRGTRRFGQEEWKLLERRLTEWKSAVADARQVVEDAEALAAAGPITSQRRPQQRRQQQEEEVAA